MKTCHDHAKSLIDHWMSSGESLCDDNSVSIIQQFSFSQKRIYRLHNHKMNIAYLTYEKNHKDIKKTTIPINFLTIKKKKANILF